MVQAPRGANQCRRMCSKIVVHLSRTDRFVPVHFGPAVLLRTVRNRSACANQATQPEFINVPCKLAGKASARWGRPPTYVFDSADSSDQVAGGTSPTIAGVDDARDSTVLPRRRARPRPGVDTVRPVVSQDEATRSSPVSKAVED